MIRHLHEAATEEAFTAGLNGFITRWDGKNDLGELVPAGRYAARGYGVGPLKVEGVEFVGNDWVDADESLRIEHIEALALVPPSADLLVTAFLVGGSKTQVRFSAEDGSVISKGLPDSSAPRPQTISAGKDGSSWVVSVGTLYQLPANTSDPAGLITTPEKLALLAMRVLAPSSNEPPIRAVSASASQDKLYVLEQMPGWQRVRGLAWLEAKEEDGRKVSNWETFFERSIRPADPARGLDPAAKSVPSVRFQLAATHFRPARRPRRNSPQQSMPQAATSLPQTG